MRNITSCSFCRDRKKRCSFAPSQDSCRECSSRDLVCSLKKQSPNGTRGLAPRHRSIVSHPHTSSESPPFSDDGGLPYHVLNDESLCDELVEIYFDLMHDKQHLIFHPATFIAEYKARKTPKFLIWVIGALISRYSNHPSISSVPRRQRGPLWLVHAIDAFNARIEQINIASLQGAILLSFAYFVEGDVAREQLLAAQAIRMIQVLRIPNANGTDPVLYETQVRLYWQCWMSDTWHCARAQYPRQIADDPAIARPMEERQFSQLGSHLQPATIRDGMPGIGANRNGLWTAMLPLTKLHSEIMALNYSLLDVLVDPIEGYNQVRELAERIEQWHDELPSRLLYTPANIEYHNREGLGREFNVLNLQYHFQSQMLYYRFLQDATDYNTHSTHAADSAMYAARCKDHATAISEIMWAGTIQPGMECFWSPVNGHLIVVASSVLLHTLMCDDDERKTAKARKLLEQNFKMLLQLQEFWPSLENSMSRLQAFHRLCVSSPSSRHAFSMDQWMVQWLNKYNEPVEDKDSSDITNHVELISLISQSTKS